MRIRAALLAVVLLTFSSQKPRVQENIRNAFRKIGEAFRNGDKNLKANWKALGKTARRVGGRLGSLVH